MFWGTVVSYSYVDNIFCTVEDNQGVLRQCCFNRLFIRVKFLVAVGGVLNDKTNDRHYQQNFIEREIRWLEDCLVRKRQEDVGKGKGGFPIIYRIFLHMDNVYQNFKITGGI